MSLRVFSTSRLAITAGLEVAPIISIGLPIILPADAVVRAVRCYDHDNSIILLWTPNQAEVAYCPGRNPNPAGVAWPQQPDDLAARRVDGSFGRFDYAIYAQSWSVARCWAPAMIIIPEGSDGQYETLSVLPWWTDTRNSRGGYVLEAALLALKARYQALAGACALARSRLANSSGYYIGPELLHAFPTLPSGEIWRRLSLSIRFEEAVDLWASYVRQLRSVEAAVHMAHELHEYQVAGCPAATSCPSVAAQDNRLGVWANDVSPEWLQLLLHTGYKIYIAHKTEQDAMYPLDYNTITSEDWAEGDSTQETERNEWLRAAREEGWRLRSPSDAAANVSATVVSPANGSVWREPWSDPRNYDYVMGGEERRARLLPPARETSATAAPATEATSTEGNQDATPSAAAPPPAYSTLPDTPVSTIEGMDGVTYRLPPRGSRLYRPRLERVVIDPAHHPWLQPPPRRELGRGRSMEAFIPVEVTINGQNRTVFRRIGTRNTARNGFILTQDYVNCRNIYLPSSFRPPVGTVDEELWGFPAPVTFYFDLPNSQDVSNALPPSVWLYPTDRAARNLARPGAVPPRPSPSQLPRLHDETRQPLLNENPEDCVMPVDDESDHDDDMDKDGGDFYSMPADTECRDHSPPPLPLYSATPQDDEMIVEDDTVPTQNDRSSAPAPTTLPPHADEQRTAAVGPAASQSTQRERSAPPSAAASGARGPATSTDSTSRPPSPPFRVVNERFASHRSQGEDSRSSSQAALQGPSSAEPADGSRPLSHSWEANRGRAASRLPGQTVRSGGGGSSGWGSASTDAVATGWRSDPRPWAGLPHAAPPPVPSVATSPTNGFLVVRHINRWVHAVDLESAIRRLLDSMPGPRPRLLTAYGRNARPPTEHERQDRRSPPFNFYLQFATEAEAVRVRQAMGHPWPITTTNRQGEDRGSRGVFRAYNIDSVSHDEFRAVRSDPNAWVYPWQGLYDTAAAPPINPAGSIGGPPTTAPPPTWLTPAQQAAFGVAHSGWPFPPPAFMPASSTHHYPGGAAMGTPYVVVPSGMLGAMYPPPPPPPAPQSFAEVSTQGSGTSQSASTSSSLSPMSSGRSLASRLSSPSPDSAGLSLLDRISDRDSDASDSRGRRRSRPRRRRGYSPPSYNGSGPGRRRSPPPPPPPPPAGVQV